MARFCLDGFPRAASCHTQARTEAAAWLGLIRTLCDFMLLFILKDLSLLRIHCIHIVQKSCSFISDSVISLLYWGFCYTGPSLRHVSRSCPENFSFSFAGEAAFLHLIACSLSFLCSKKVNVEDRVARSLCTGFITTLYWSHDTLFVCFCFISSYF